MVDHERRNGLPRAESNVTLAGDGYDEWLRIENAPVVHLSGPDSLLDDELVSPNWTRHSASGGNTYSRPLRTVTN